jgi:hypothetical protein
MNWLEFRDLTPPSGAAGAARSTTATYGTIVTCPVMLGRWYLQIS